MDFTRNFRIKNPLTPIALRAGIDRKHRNCNRNRRTEPHGTGFGIELDGTEPDGTEWNRMEPDGTAPSGTVNRRNRPK